MIDTAGIHSERPGVALRAIAAATGRLMASSGAAGSGSGATKIDWTIAKSRRSGSANGRARALSPCGLTTRATGVPGGKTPPAPEVTNWSPGRNGVDAGADRRVSRPARRRAHRRRPATRRVARRTGMTLSGSVTSITRATCRARFRRRGRPARRGRAPAGRQHALPPPGIERGEAARARSGRADQTGGDDDACRAFLEPQQAAQTGVFVRDARAPAAPAAAQRSGGGVRSSFWLPART